MGATFYRAQHGNGRRDDAIAVKKRSTQKAENEDPCTPCSRLRMARVQQSEHRNYTAFATVVRAQD
jgi:hypothetical protein